MKKTYIEPTTLVVRVKTNNLLVVVSVEGTTNSGTADSRRGGSSWDDEEDE